MPTMFFDREPYVSSLKIHASMKAKPVLSLDGDRKTVLSGLQISYARAEVMDRGTHGA
jgi:hypothetical protein